MELEKKKQKKLDFISQMTAFNVEYVKKSVHRNVLKNIRSIRHTVFTVDYVRRNAQQVSSKEKESKLCYSQFGQHF